MLCFHSDPICIFDERGLLLGDFTVNSQNSVIQEFCLKIGTEFCREFRKKPLRLLTSTHCTVGCVDTLRIAVVFSLEVPEFAAFFQEGSNGARGMAEHRVVDPFFSYQLQDFGIKSPLQQLVLRIKGSGSIYKISVVCCDP